MCIPETMALLDFLSLLLFRFPNVLVFYDIMTSKPKPIVIPNDGIFLFLTFQQIWFFSRMECWNRGFRVKVWVMQTKSWHILLSQNLENLLSMGSPTQILRAWLQHLANGHLQLLLDCTLVASLARYSCENDGLPSPHSGTVNLYWAYQIFLSYDLLDDPLLVFSFMFINSNQHSCVVTFICRSLIGKLLRSKW